VSRPRCRSHASPHSCEERIFEAAWGRSNARHRARERGNERALLQTSLLRRMVDVSRGFRRTLCRRLSHYRQIQTLTVTFFYLTLAGGGVFKNAALQVLRKERRLMSTGEVTR
jgi:hypothetical protein